MLPMSSLLSLALAWFVSAYSQPVFPEGVAPLMESMGEKQKGATASKDDAGKVEELERGAGAAAQEDLAEEAGATSESKSHLIRGSYCVATR